jgi:crotonobetainyl-CoA:carnitine CoA-transferase CaiB-like acyl-CoA transferase
MAAAPHAALGGLRVLDMTRVLAGPMCTMLLGDYGAEVIKIEPPGKGDDVRGWGPPFVGHEAAYFLGFNRNKRSVTLNLDAAGGKAVLGALARKADVVIDNYKAGTLERWGFTNEWFEANAPRAIRCSITGYGTSGPKAGLPGYDFILQAESGLMSITGTRDGGPMKYGVAVVDMVTGLLAANAILTALHARQETGRGQRIECSLYDSSIFMLANVANNYLASGKEPGRFGNGHPNVVPYDDYPTADGRLVLACGNDAQFERVATLLGHPEWLGDPRFAKVRDRVAHRAAMDAAVSEAFRTQPTAYWIEQLQAAGVPCGPISSVSQAVDDLHTLAREMIRHVAHPAMGEYRQVGNPVKMSDTPAALRRAPPTLGEHTDEVLTNELGYTPGRIAALRASGVV